MSRLVAWREGRAGRRRDSNRFLGSVYLRVGDGGVTVVSKGEVIRVPASKLVRGRRHGVVVNERWGWAWGWGCDLCSC